MRDTDDKVEKIGVDRAKKRLEQCGLLLAVFDNSRELDDDDMQLLETAAQVPTIAIINKTDLENQLDITVIESKVKNIITISAARGEGREAIVEAVEKIAGTDRLNPSEGILSNERQRELLEMTGEKTGDEVIDRVFHNFCVGK